MKKSTLFKAALKPRRPGDFLLFFEIFFTILGLPRKIRSQSLPRLLKSLDPGVSCTATDEAGLRKTTNMVDALLEFKLLRRYGRCFLRSLTLFKFLRRQGWPVEIRFGIMKTGDGDRDITGHSWLVLDGEVFLEDQQRPYVTTYAYPGDTVGDSDVANNGTSSRNRQ